MFLKPTLLPGSTRDPAQREGPGRLVKPREQRVSLAFPAGGLCGDGTGACYLLPVFDTVFVRKRYRRQGLGLAMLRDFCETFREDEALGVSWPISPAMYQGSLCGDGTGACYLLPVFDTVFVRRRYRRQGLGLAMLRDFCETFREDEGLGVSWPIPAMVKDLEPFPIHWTRGPATWKCSPRERGMKVYKPD
ncbi:Protein FAM169B [Camelus dromedarius]|uniref:Protein FAM169B n=1 Tax=Camelus dromedarius TaxID=9838 RepID=A0A5N4CEQ8_CAMDR|nr:Protein FAM169B [Camelus dromedarius]